MSAGRTDIILSLGELPEKAAGALLDAGLRIRICQDAYDAAAALADARDSVRALHIASDALSSKVLALMRLMRDRQRGVALWVGPGSRQSSMLPALAALGAVPANDVFAGLIDAGLPSAPATSSPHQRKDSDTADLAQHAPPAQTPHPAAPTRRISDEAIAFRNPAKTPADNAPSDNHLVSGQGIDRDLPARYDALTEQPLLSDDELRALLDPSDDSTSA